MTRKLPKFKEPISLNLGCGKEKMKGYVGIDIRDMGQEIIWDLKEGMPFPDNSIDEIYSCHFLEHLDDDASSNLFLEIYRILKKGGLTKNRLPHVKDPTAFYTGHKTFWNEERIHALIRFPGLENFKILNNERIGGELFFTLKKC